MNLTDRFKAGIEAFVRRLMTRYDYSGVHGYTVVSQNSDFTLELKPDDPKNDPALSSVPIKYDSPSNRVTVEAGATCNVMYTNMDPSRYFAFGFDPGDYELIEMGTDGRKIATVGSLVQSGGALTYALLTGPLTLTGPNVVKIGFLSAASTPSPADFVGAGKLTGVVITGCTKGKAK